MENPTLEKEEAKNRILNASIQLFSEKGFDATRVNEIAANAKVNKALIYYYFESKEDILDFLVRRLLDDVTSFSMDFINDNILEMVEDGELTVESERLHFNDQKAVAKFLKKTQQYYQLAVHYALDNRQIVRIIMDESLKNSKHKNALFQFLFLLRTGESDLVRNSVAATEKKFTNSDEFILYKFYFALMPIATFAAYFEDYKALTQQKGEEVISKFLNTLQLITSSLVSGSDILLNND